MGSHSGSKNKTQLTSRADFQPGTLWAEAIRTPFVMSTCFVLDVTTVSCRPWSALRPGKARPRPRLVKLSQTASRLYPGISEGRATRICGCSLKATQMRRVSSNRSIRSFRKAIATSTQCEFQHQCSDDPLEKTGSDCSAPALAMMPVESLESPALLFLRKVEAKGPNCFCKLETC